MSEDMTITCETHGEVEAIVDANHNAWCPECRNDMIREGLKDPEKRRQLAEAMKPVPMSMGTVTTKRPLHLFPPVALSEDIGGIEPPFQKHYIRHLKVDEG